VRLEIASAESSLVQAFGATIQRSLMLRCLQTSWSRHWHLRVGETSKLSDRGNWRKRAGRRESLRVGFGIQRGHAASHFPGNCPGVPDCRVSITRTPFKVFRSEVERGCRRPHGAHKRKKCGARSGHRTRPIHVRIRLIRQLPRYPRQEFQLLLLLQLPLADPNSPRRQDLLARVDELVLLQPILAIIQFAIAAAERDELAV
jgi:hypothetical protein